MTTHTSPRRRGLIALAATAVVAAALPATAAAAPAAREEVNYVAMGDSFASGVDVPPYVEGSGCARSQRDYAHLLAAEKGWNLNDVTCRGATFIKGVWGDDPRNDPGEGGFFEDRNATVPAQMKAIKPTTDIVTIQMGAIDSGVSNAFINCVKDGLTEGNPIYGSACKDRHDKEVADGVPLDERRYGIDIDRAAQQLDRALNEIHEIAPAAQVFVVGYPQVLPEPVAGGIWPCYNLAPVPDARGTGPVSRQDGAWLRGERQNVNSKFKEIAENHNAEGGSTTFVNTFDAFDGHDACRLKANRWVYGVQGTQWTDDQEGRDMAQWGSGHPNEAGHQQIAFILADSTP